MKKNIHPEYFPNAKVTCACGNVFYVGSTKKELAVEICYACHPFYTGKEKLIDTAGRVERFKAKREKASKTAIRSKTAKRATKAAKKATKETKKFK
jgi:large subunit ribosomal protein L31